MAQKVRKRPENELLDIKISASNGFQNKKLKFKRREREQKLEIFDPPRRPPYSSEKKVKGKKTWTLKNRPKRLSFFFPKAGKKNWNFCEK